MTISVLITNRSQEHPMGIRRHYDDLPDVTPVHTILEPGQTVLEHVWEGSHIFLHKIRRPVMGTAAVLTLIEGILQLTPQAITLWNTLKPILSEGREPTADEWVVLNKMRDDAHAAIQAEQLPGSTAAVAQAGTTSP